MRLKIYYSVILMSLRDYCYSDVYSMNDRAISYLYEWKKGGTIFRNITHEQFNQEFTEYLLLGCLEDIKHCLETYGELGCIYKTQGNDGIMIVSGIGIYFLTTMNHLLPSFLETLLLIYIFSPDRKSVV